MYKKYISWVIISILSLGLFSVSLMAKVPSRTQNLEKIHFGENMHADPEFEGFYRDVVNSKDLDISIAKLNQGEYGNVFLLTNGGRIVAGASPDLAGKYIRDAKDADGHGIGCQILQGLNAPEGQDYFVNATGQENSDSSQTIYMLRTRYVKKYGVLVVKVYPQTLLFADKLPDMQPLLGAFTVSPPSSDSKK